MDMETKGVLLLITVGVVIAAIMLAPIFLKTSTCVYCHKKVAPCSSSVLNGASSKATLCEECCDEIIQYIHSSPVRPKHDN